MYFPVDLDAPALGGLLSGITLNFEPISRQSEITLYAMNKSMETGYKLLRRRNYPVRLPYGEALLTAIAISILSYHYFQNREAIRPTYLRVLDKVVGQY